MIFPRLCLWFLFWLALCWGGLCRWLCPWQRLGRRGRQLRLGDGRDRRVDDAVGDGEHAGQAYEDGAEAQHAGCDDTDRDGVPLAPAAVHVQPRGGRDVHARKHGPPTKRRSWKLVCHSFFEKKIKKKK